MKQEDELLFRDLCARLPYGVKIKVTYSKYSGSSLRARLCSEGINTLDTNILWLFQQSEIYVKLYLFPLSSMTEEQKKFFKDRPIFLDSENELVVKEDFFGNNQFTMLDDWMEVILWLVKNHFDYKNLIPKGLAIDCTNLNIY